MSQDALNIHPSNNNNNYYYYRNNNTLHLLGAFKRLEVTLQQMMHKDDQISKDAT